MRFLYPLGLLGLLAIPLLILIYILKNKHTEQMISSTYLWTLSERFLKRRNPISKLAGIISLVLQILIVACISIGIAHPEITLRGKADDYVFILDASGSMHYEEKGGTRFELGKEKIAAMIEKSADGSSYTLITAGETTGTMFEDVTDKKQALAFLEGAEISAAAPALAEMQKLAQEKFTANPSSKLVLVTDKNFDDLENVELVKIAKRQENYAVSDLAYVLQGGKLFVSGKAVSYESDETLKLRLDVTDAEQTRTQEQTVEVSALNGGNVAEMESNFQFEVNGTIFDFFKVTVENEDALPLDNESVVYNPNNVEEDTAKILLVGEDPFFLQQALSALVGEESVETTTIENYNGEKGYQLYVFESCTPAELPDGPVWFVNPTGDVKDSGFTVVEGAGTDLDYQRTLQYNTSTSSRVRDLLREVNGDEIFVKHYVKCNFYRSFHALLSLDGEPVLAAGTNGKNQREVVFAFDFHKSDFILTFDFMTLIRNLWRYSYPTMVAKTSYECGEIVPINVFSDSEGLLRIDTPSGGIVHLDTSGDVVEYVLAEVGTYTFTQMRGTGAKSVEVYSNLPKTERFSQTSESGFVVEGAPSANRRDGIYDDLLVLLILLAVIFLVDWGVYCYEQYQLR